MSGKVVAVCIGDGGIPKHPVEGAEVGALGLAGDGHRRSFHGGERRAVCLLSIEEVALLRADGVDVGGPGSFGENVLTEGVDLNSLAPGDRLAVGDTLVLEMDDVREPCATLKPVDARFPDLMVGRSGILCRVVEPGRVATGDAILVVS